MMMMLMMMNFEQGLWCFVVLQMNVELLKNEILKMIVDFLDQLHQDQPKMMKFLRLEIPFQMQLIAANRKKQTR
jgi:hypothetical protein